MPMIDMPLEEMRTYRGSSPCPAGFDEYWDAQIRLVDEMELSWTCTPNEYTSEKIVCYDLVFQGIDGAAVHAKYVRPNGDQEVPLILEFHGYRGRSRTWLELISFCSLGHAVIAMDCRGQAGESCDPGTGCSASASPSVSGHIIAGILGDISDLYYRKVFIDTLILARIALSLEGIDTGRITTFGGSQGGALALVCAALEPRIDASLSLYPFLSDYRRVWEMDLDTNAYDGLRYLFKHFDPEHAREEELFERLGYIDVKNLAQRIHGTCILGTGLIDTICPPSTQFAVYNNLGDLRVTGPG